MRIHVGANLRAIGLPLLIASKLAPAVLMYLIAKLN
jgi:hypothetical protein